LPISWVSCLFKIPIAKSDLFEYELAIRIVFEIAIPKRIASLLPVAYSSCIEIEGGLSIDTN
jgi:hypothetical protein